MDKCKLDINGSGTAKVNVSSELDASIDVSGEVAVVNVRNLEVGFVDGGFEGHGLLSKTKRLTHI